MAMRVRRAVLMLLAAAAVAVLAGCTLPPPPGDAPLRYRDVVFGSVGVTRDLTYGSAPDLQGNPVTLKLDLYQPTGDTVARRPAFVWVHGGGFTMGDKASGASVATYYAQRGFVVVSINYRLLAPPGCAGDPDPAPECQTAALAAQHDGQAAVRWLRANASTYRIDTNRISMGGGSAGAITSLLAAWHSEDPGDSGNPGYSSRIAAAVSISGGAPTNELITAGDSPAIFFHGTADRVVFYSWAVSNAAAMHDAGIPVVLEPLEGAGHGLLGTQYRDLILQQADYFLYYQMDLGNAEGG
jgi:acetyl esterase/lipase